MSIDEWEALKQELRMLEDGHPDIRINFAPKLLDPSEGPFLLAVVVLKEKWNADGPKGA